MLEQAWSLNLRKSGPSWSWFDAERYARSDAIAARALRRGEEAALEDYEDRGAALGHSPNMFFDPGFYIARHPWVAQAIASGDFRSAFEHYRLIGWRDHSPHYLFDIGRYAHRYDDLPIDLVEELGGYWGHFLRDGAAGLRSGHLLFDPVYYLGTLSDAERAAARANPLAHYLAAIEALEVDGAEGEPRSSPYFDPAWYRATYPAACKPLPGQRFRGALHHYIIYGSGAAHDPLCDFSEAYYRRQNPDVAQVIADGPVVNGYEHFLDNGASEGRSPSPEIDIGWYAHQPAVRRDLDSGRFAHPFEHVLRVGIPNGYLLRPPVSRLYAPDETATRQAFLAQAIRAIGNYGRRRLDFTVTGTPAVSVIVVLHNQFELTMQTLASLRENYPDPVELVIVDNASRDGTVAIEDLVTGATLLRQERNLGFLRACNLALAHATAPAVLYLNNDLVLHPDALRAALQRLQSDPSIGAVGGKVLRTHGLLQEAGCVLWRDGSAEGWMRDAPPDAPEANYVRDVDFCSGCFLLVDGALLRSLGGFDEAFVPAYYEEVDLCLRILAAGRRVVYDPAVALTHYEYGSARSARAAVALMATNRNTLRTRHASALRSRGIDRRHRADAVSVATRGRRVLMIEDTVPLKRLGSGFGRAAEVLRGLDAAGWQATLFPMTPVTTPPYRLTAELPERVEALWDRSVLDLEAFLAERQGYYDLVWVSRAHNLRRLAEIVSRPGNGLGQARLVLDTEAVFSVRDAAKAALDGLPFNMRAALEREFDGAWLCDHVAAVNETEAELLRGVGLGSVSVVGFDVPAMPTPAAFERRCGLLHVGALNGDDSPNAEGLRWYLTHVHPIVAAAVGPEQSRVTVIGHSVEGVGLDWLREHPGVRYLGPVTDLAPHYDSHRGFIAPTRFAAGVATKILDAAARGIPVVCTDLLAGQMGWTGGNRVLSAPLRDAEAFGQAVIRLLTDKRTWRDVRAGALRAIRTEFDPARFASQLRDAVVAAGVRPPR